MLNKLKIYSRVPKQRFSSELPEVSESYNSHLLKPVKLTIVTCLKLVKGHKRIFFHLFEFKKSD